MLSKNLKRVKAAKPAEEEPAALDDMLEDDYDASFNEKDELKKIDSSLKIADDNYVDGDEGI